MSFDYSFRYAESKKEIDGIVSFILTQPLGYPNFEDWVERSRQELLYGNKRAIVAFSDGFLVGPKIARMVSIITKEAVSEEGWKIEIDGEDYTYRISQLEKKLGISLDIQELDARSRDTRETHTKEEWFEPERSSPATIDFQSSISKSSVKLFLAEQYANKSVNLYIGDDYCMTVKVGHGGLIKIKKGNKIAKLLAQAIENGLLRVKV